MKPPYNDDDVALRATLDQAKSGYDADLTTMVKDICADLARKGDPIDTWCAASIGYERADPRRIVFLLSTAVLRLAELSRNQGQP